MTNIDRKFGDIERKVKLILGLLQSDVTTTVKQGSIALKKDPNFKPPSLPMKTTVILEQFNRNLLDDSYLAQMVFQIFFSIEFSLC